MATYEKSMEHLKAKEGKREEMMAKNFEESAAQAGK